MGSGEGQKENPAKAGDTVTPLQNISKKTAKRILELVSDESVRDDAVPVLIRKGRQEEYPHAAQLLPTFPAQPAVGGWHSHSMAQVGCRVLGSGHEWRCSLFPCSLLSLSAKGFLIERKLLRPLRALGKHECTLLRLDSIFSVSCLLAHQSWGFALHWSGHCWGTASMFDLSPPGNWELSGKVWSRS